MGEGHLPLSGTIVVALEHSVAGPLCTRILGDLGATVVKVERPGGDFARHWDDHVDGEGAQFWWLNRNKQSVVLDLREPDQRARFDELLGGADVFVHNLSPRAADGLGLTGAEFDERHRRLVHCQISGYGHDGPSRDRKAYDMLVQGEAGFMSLTGTPEQACRVGVSICDVSTGIYAATLVLAALRERDLRGVGRRLDVAMLDVATEFAAPMLLSFANAGVIYPRLADQHHAIAPYGVFETADGREILIAIHQDAEWRRLCEVLIEQPELGADARYATTLDRVTHRRRVVELVAEAVGRRDHGEVVEVLDRAGIAHSSVNGIPELLEHDVVRQRGVIAQADGPRGVVRSYVGIAERLFDPAGDRRSRPPDLDQHGRAVRDDGDEGTPRVA